MPVEASFSTVKNEGGERYESHRKLQRELAHETRRSDPLAAAENRRRWKSIHKAVGKHMDRKYGEDWR